MPVWGTLKSKFVWVRYLFDSGPCKQLGMNPKGTAVEQDCFSIKRGYNKIVKMKLSGASAFRIHLSVGCVPIKIQILIDLFL